MPSVVRKLSLLVKTKLSLRSSSLLLTQVKVKLKFKVQSFYEYIINFVKLDEKLMVSQALIFFKAWIFCNKL